MSGANVITKSAKKESKNESKNEKIFASSNSLNNMPYEVELPKECVLKNREEKKGNFRTLRTNKKSSLCLVERLR